MFTVTRIVKTTAANRSAFKIGCWLILLVTLPIASYAQTGPVPEYISSMSTFEVRRLDDSYSPTNGNISMESVTPAEWLNNDPSVLGLDAVVAAWSGGGKSNGTKMFVHGGGHQDGANNGMYIYDFDGQSNPTGWHAPLVISDVADIREVAPYADGKPNSVHTYDGVVHASHNNHVYRFGGSRWISGTFAAEAYKFNVLTGQWTQLQNYPRGQGTAQTIYDPVSGKIFVTMTNDPYGHFLRTSDDSWSERKSVGGDFPHDSMAAWDTRRNRAIVVGDGETSVVTVDFAAETIFVEPFNPSGATELLTRSGISAVYDPERDVYWLFGGDAGSPGYDSIYEMRADGSPWSITRYSLDLGGDSIPFRQDMQGSWGRFALMPRWGAIGLVASVTSPAFVIKLPDSQIQRPEAPQDLQAD